MIKLIFFLFALVLFEKDAQAKVFEIDFPGSFDELTSSNGEYRIEGKVSPDDMFGFNAVLCTQEVCIVASCGRANSKCLLVENYSDDLIFLKSIPVGVQSLVLRSEVDLMSNLTNTTVRCVSIERDCPSTTNVIKNIVSSFPNLEILHVQLFYNEMSNASFDVSECVGGARLRCLYIESSHPLKNLGSIDILKKMDAVLIKYEKVGKLFDVMRGGSMK